MTKSNSKKTDELVTKTVFKKEIKRLDTRIDKLDGTVTQLRNRVDYLSERKESTRVTNQFPQQTEFSSLSHSLRLELSKFKNFLDTLKPV